MSVVEIQAMTERPTKQLLNIIVCVREMSYVNEILRVQLDF